MPVNGIHMPVNGICSACEDVFRYYTGQDEFGVGNACAVTQGELTADAFHALLHVSDAVSVSASGFE